MHSTVVGAWGACGVQHAPPQRPRNPDPAALLPAASCCAQAAQLHVQFVSAGLHVQPGDALGLVRVAVALPVHVWEGPSRWRPSPAAAMLLSALVPLTQQDGAQQPQECAGDDWGHWREQLRLMEQLRSGAASSAGG